MKLELNQKSIMWVLIISAVAGVLLALLVPALKPIAAS